MVPMLQQTQTTTNKISREQSILNSKDRSKKEKRRCINIYNEIQEVRMRIGWGMRCKCGLEVEVFYEFV